MQITAAAAAMNPATPFTYILDTYFYYYYYYTFYAELSLSIYSVNSFFNKWYVNVLKTPTNTLADLFRNQSLRVISKNTSFFSYYIFIRSSVASVNDGSVTFDS